MLEQVRIQAMVWYRAFLAILRHVKESGLDYRAMSLVYTSLLALIPVLAVSFSVLKAFGADSYLEDLLLSVLSPLRDSAEPVAAFILDSVRKLDVGVLGSVGLLSLLYTSVSLLEKIEESFNHIWRKRARVSRGLLRRFSDYLSFILVGPLLVFLALGGVSAIFQRRPELPWLEGAYQLVLPIVQTVLPTFFIVAAFAFFYQVIPNAPVKPRSALFGGLMAGLAWKFAGWIFAMFFAGSAQYHAVYSTLAFLVLFMVWLYLSWLIVLLGVQATFFHQHPRYLFIHGDHFRLSPRLSQHLGLLAMVLIGRRFFRGERPMTLPELAEWLALPDDCVEEVLQVLSGKGFIMALGGEAGAFVPARDLSTIKLVDVMSALRTAHEDELPLEPQKWAEPRVDDLMMNLEAAMRKVEGDASLRDLVEEDDR